MNNTTRKTGSKVILMESEENKVTKASDNVLTPEQTPSYTFGITLALVVLFITILVASFYYGILNI